MVKIAESLKKYISPEALAELEKASTLAEADRAEKVKAREEAQGKIEELLAGLQGVDLADLPNFTVRDGQVKMAGVKGSGNGSGLGIPKSPTSPLTLEKDGQSITIGKGQEVSLNKWYKTNGGKTPQDNGGTGKTVSRKSVEAFAVKQGWTIKA